MVQLQCGAKKNSHKQPRTLIGQPTFPTAENKSVGIQEGSAWIQTCVRTNPEEKDQTNTDISVWAAQVV